MLPVILIRMERGGYHKATGGFTIVEVMIVLAVSGMLLVSAAALIDGRQSRTEFTTAVNDEQQQIQQIINETASGYYPNNQDFTCTPNPTSSPVLTKSTPGTGTRQGANQGCIFLGKAIQFGLGTSLPTNTMLGVIPIVGNQYQGGTYNPVLTVAQSIPRAAYPVSASEVTVPASMEQSDTMEYGLTMAAGNSACGLVSAVCYKPVSGGGVKAAGMAAFISGDSAGNIAANATGSTSNLQSGAEQMSLYGVKSSAINNGLNAASMSVGSPTRTIANGLGNLDPATEVMICVASAGTTQSGLFTIGGNGTGGANGALTVTLKIMSDLTC
jgi:prepilin-type N-terminal cleavage/methylation domain-containing protein